MSLLETATAYLLDLLVKNEEVKKFPQAFITASTQWVRSWFLTDEIKAGGDFRLGDKNLC